MNLNELCKNLTQEFTQLSSSDNKLKLVLVLIHIIEEASKQLTNIDINDFITQIKDKINNLESQASNLTKEYHVHLYQNNEVKELLTNDNNNEITDLQDQINNLLTQYDKIIKRLIEIREKLPIEKQIELEK